MPTYSYACTECGHRFDAQQAFTDDALTECPQCGGRLRKLFGNVGVVFKGSGFYRTDARNDGKRTGSAARSGSSSGSGSAADTGAAAGSGTAAPATTGGDSGSSGASSSGASGSGSSTAGSAPSGSTSGSAPAAAG